jgi:hypothetical protein
MSEQQQKFEQWAIVELFGHQRIAGLVTEQAVGGCSFVRVGVPETPNNPAWTRPARQRRHLCDQLRECGRGHDRGGRVQRRAGLLVGPEGGVAAARQPEGARGRLRPCMKPLAAELRKLTPARKPKKLSMKGPGCRSCPAVSRMRRTLLPCALLLVQRAARADPRGEGRMSNKVNAPQFGMRDRAYGRPQPHVEQRHGEPIVVRLEREASRAPQTKERSA